MDTALALVQGLEDVIKVRKQHCSKPCLQSPFYQFRNHFFGIFFWCVRGFIALPMWLWRRRRRRLLPVLHLLPGWEADLRFWSETTDWLGSRNLQSTERSKNLQEASRTKKCYFQASSLDVPDRNDLWSIISHFPLPWIENKYFRNLKKLSFL